MAGIRLLAALWLLCYPVNGTLLEDCQVLKELYTATKGSKWTTACRWDVTNDACCTWFGITCSTNDTAVTRVHVSLSNLTADVLDPANVTLRSINCNVHGTLPSAILSLTSMEFFAMDQASGTGKLSGTIPSGLETMTALEEFYITSNKVSGTVPPFVLRAMRTLGIAKNRISGTIPDEFNATVFGAHIRTRGLMVSYNQISGTIPETIQYAGAYSGAISHLISHNHFSGTIPMHLFTNPWLINVDLSRNKISGTLPTHLDAKYLPDNSPSLPTTSPTTEPTIAPTPAPTSSGRTATNMLQFNVGSNQLSGTIPQTLKFRSSLSVIILAHNKFSGTIPSNVTGFSVLTSFTIERNRVSGTLPVWMSQSKTLSIFSASHNRLQGSIPSFGDATYLRTLLLADNRFFCTPPPLPNSTHLGEGGYIDSLSGANEVVLQAMNELLRQTFNLTALLAVLSDEDILVIQALLLYYDHWSLTSALLLTPVDKIKRRNMVAVFGGNVAITRSASVLPSHRETWLESKDVNIRGLHAPLLQYHEPQYTVIWVFGMSLLWALFSIQVQASYNGVTFKQMFSKFVLMSLDWRVEQDQFPRLLKHFFVPINAFIVPALAILAMFWMVTETYVDTKSVVSLIGSDPSCWSFESFGTIGLAYLVPATQYAYTLVILLIQTSFFLMLVRYFTDPRRKQVRRIYQVLSLFEVKGLSNRHQFFKNWAANAAPKSKHFLAKYKFREDPGRYFAVNIASMDLPDNESHKLEPPLWVKVLRELVYLSLHLPFLLIVAIPIVLHVYNLQVGGELYFMVSPFVTAMCVLGLRQGLLWRMSCLISRIYCSAMGLDEIAPCFRLRMQIGAMYIFDMLSIVIIPLICVLILDDNCYRGWLIYNRSTYARLEEWELGDYGSSTSEKCIRAFFVRLGPLWEILLCFHALTIPVLKLTKNQPWFIKLCSWLRRVGKTERHTGLSTWAGREERLDFEKVFNGHEAHNDAFADEQARVAISISQLYTSCSMTLVLGPFCVWLFFIGQIGLYFNLMTELMVTSDESIQNAASAQPTAQARVERYWAGKFATMCVALVVQPPIIVVAIFCVLFQFSFTILCITCLEFPSGCIALYVVLSACIATTMFFLTVDAATTTPKDLKEKHVGEHDETDVENSSFPDFKSECEPAQHLEMSELSDVVIQKNPMASPTDLKADREPDSPSSGYTDRTDRRSSAIKDIVLQDQSEAGDFTNASKMSTTTARRPRIRASMIQDAVLKDQHTVAAEHYNTGAESRLSSLFVDDAGASSRASPRAKRGGAERPDPVLQSLQKSQQARARGSERGSETSQRSMRRPQPKEPRAQLGNEPITDTMLTDTSMPTETVSRLSQWMRKKSKSRKGNDTASELGATEVSGFEDSEHFSESSPLSPKTTKTKSSRGAKLSFRDLDSTIQL